MSNEIVIEVGDSFAERHEHFLTILGEQYDEQMRTLVEDEIHTMTKQLERQAENQQAATEAADLDELDEE